MNKILYLLTIVLLLNSCKSPEEEKPEFNIQHQNIKNYVELILKEKEVRPFNGVILISENGKTIVEKSIGFSDFESKTKNSIDTQFIIASLSKQITAALILKLEEENKLTVSDTISKFLPDLPQDISNKITIHQLLSHTSGLKGKQLGVKPGTEFNYSNYGFNLLGKITEKASGKSYDQQVLELFKELGMSKSTTASAYKSGNLANGYNGEEGKGLEKIESILEHTQSNSIGVPAGGIISTANDLVLWNESLHNGKVIKDSTIYKKMIQPHAERDNETWGLSDYGYGVQLAKGNPKEIYHGGYIKGFSAANIYFPESKTSVILLENVSNSQKNIRYIFDYQIKIESFLELLETTNHQKNILYQVNHKISQ